MMYTGWINLCLLGDGIEEKNGSIGVEEGSGQHLMVYWMGARVARKRDWAILHPLHIGIKLGGFGSSARCFYAISYCTYQPFEIFDILLQFISRRRWFVLC